MEYTEGDYHEKKCKVSIVLNEFTLCFLGVLLIIVSLILPSVLNRWTLVIIDVIGVLLIVISILIIFRNKYKENKKTIETGGFWFIIGSIGLVLIIYFLLYTPKSIKPPHDLTIVGIFEIIGSYIAGVGVFFSYFYNKREERKIKVHSEANWRGRLFDLTQKKNLTYRDIMYFLTFFNNNAKQEDECDYKLLEAVHSIIFREG